jgi:hypothetical protein
LSAVIVTVRTFVTVLSEQLSAAEAGLARTAAANAATARMRARRAIRGV